MNPWSRFKWWRTRRRIDRILRDVGWDTGFIFRGNVTVRDVRYPDTGREPQDG